MRHIFSPVRMVECGELLGEILVVGEDSDVVIAEGDDDGAGEGCGVDEVGGSELAGVAETVGEDEAAFGVGVDDLDGFAVHGELHVAGLLGLGVGHVLAAAEDGDDAQVGLEQGDGAHGSDHGGGAAHVVLHLFHAIGGLDADAAGVKGDALADQSEDGRGGRGWRVRSA